MGKSPTFEPIVKSLPRSAYTLDADANSLACGSDCDIESDVAVQSARDETDINVIVRRYGVTGMLPQVAVPPSYGDFDGVFDFQSAMNLVVAAQHSFASLDAGVRKRFGNDPAEFVKFCEDRDNLPEMRKMGLAIPEVKEDTTPVPPVPVPPVPPVPRETSK